MCLFLVCLHVWQHFQSTYNLSKYEMQRGFCLRGSWFIPCWFPRCRQRIWSVFLIRSTYSLTMLRLIGFNATYLGLSASCLDSAVISNMIFSYFLSKCRGTCFNTTTGIFSESFRQVPSPALLWEYLGGGVFRGGYLEGVYLEGEYWEVFWGFNPQNESALVVKD